MIAESADSMKKIHTVVIFCNGVLRQGVLKEIGGSEYIIGVDRAAAWLLSHGITPDVAIGDFDSVTQEELTRIKKHVRRVKEYPKEKNWTDMELAADVAVKMHPREVVIYGWSGKRVDHMIGTIALLERFLLAGVAAYLRDSTNELFLLNTYERIRKSTVYPYVSVLPYTKRVVVTLNGFRYGIEKKEIYQGQTLGISNEVEENTGTIKVHEGIVLVVRSKD